MSFPARKVYFKISVLFLLILLFSFKLDLAKSAAATNTVVINEVLYDPSGSDPGQEWVELYNAGDLSVDLTGYELNAASGDYYKFPSLSLKSKSFVTVHWGKAGVDDDDEANLYTGSSGFATIGNTKSSITLFNSATHSKSTIVDYLEYGLAGQTWESTAVSAGIWTVGDFIADSKEGSSLGLNMDGADTDTSSDWQSFIAPTPNLANKTPVTYPSEIYLSEYLPYPASGNEWIEIYNGNSETKTLTGWQIDDLAGGGSSPKSFSSLVPGKGFLKIDLAASFFNNGGDSVRLLRPDGTVADETSFTLSYKANAFARDSGNSWQETTKSTPGEINVINSPVHSLTVTEIKKLLTGTRISTEAFVTAPPDLLGDNDFYIHDATGGIKVHCTCSLSSTSFGLEAKIKISSSIEESDSEKYIKTDSVAILEKNQPQTETDSIGTGEINEVNEGNLVKITGLVDHLDGTTFYLNDGSGLAKVYIKDSTGVVRPDLESGQLVRVIGVVSQSGTLKDGSANYRLLPRFQGDIEILSVTKEELSAGDSGLGGQVLGAVTQLPVTGPGDDFGRFGFFLLFLGLNLRLFIRRRFPDQG